MIYIKEDKSTKIPGGKSIYVSFEFDRRIVDLLKTMDAYYYNKNNHIWEIPMTSLSDFINKISYLDDITLFPMQEESVENKEIEVQKITNHKTKMYDYQSDGVDFGLNHDSWLLLDPPGLGKTLQIIYLAEELKKQKGLEHCLIICGINTLKTNWKKEIQKHSNLDCTILGERINKKGNSVIGSVAQRVEQLKNKISEFFVITNIETLRNDSIIKEILNGKNKFDFIVVDEIHTAKSPSSQQGKNLLKLTKAKWKVGATGTLLMNNPIDAYVPLKWIGAETANYSTFKQYYCVFDKQFHRDIIGFKNINTLKKMIDCNSLRRDKSLLNLPPKNRITEYVDMLDDQREFYKNIQDGIVSELDKIELKNDVVMNMVLRLRQATACPSILTSEPISSAKINRAVDLCNQIIESGNKVVVFSTFKDTVYELEKRLHDYNPIVATGDIDEDTIFKGKEQFQNEENPKIFLATWQKCGTGITLTRASYMIFIDIPWTFSQLEQAEDRIYRIGTKSPVFIYNLITNDTIDERVNDIVNDKGNIADYVLDDKITKKSMESLRKYIQDLN